MKALLLENIHPVAVEVLEDRGFEVELRPGSLSEADVDAAMREVRRALLEADVSLEVVRSFTDRVREQAVGATVVKSVTPGQMVVKIVHDELVATLGSDGQTIDLNAVPPVAIMMFGAPAGGSVLPSRSTLLRKLTPAITTHCSVAGCPLSMRLRSTTHACFSMMSSLVLVGT